MTILGAWLQRLIGTALVMGFLELVLPEGELHRFTRMVMGLLVVLVLLEPLAGIFHQNLGLDRILGTALGASRESGMIRGEQAVHVTAAGLEALEQARRAEMERSITAFCAKMTGVKVSRVTVTAGPDGRPRVVVRLRGAQDPSRMKSLLMSEYALADVAIEVVNDG